MKRVIFLFIISFTIILAAQMEDKNIAAAYKKSYDYETIGKYSKAIDALKDVYLNYPKTYTVNYRLGWLYYLDKKYANALEHIDKALLVYSSSIEASNTKILVHVAQLDWDKVQLECIKVIKTDYYNVTANYWYSYALRMNGDFNNSLTISTKMLGVFPTSVIFLQEMGESLYLSGELEESKKIFLSIQILDPDNLVAKAYLKNFK